MAKHASTPAAAGTPKPARPAAAAPTPAPAPVAAPANQTRDAQQSAPDGHAASIPGDRMPHGDARHMGRATRPVAQPMRVQAIKLGYYDDKLRRVDDVFDIRGPHEFSEKWMREVSTSTPERLTGSNADLRRTHDGIQAERLGIDVGRDDVPDSVPTGTRNPLGDDLST